MKLRDHGSSASIGLAISAALMAGAFVTANLLISKPPGIDPKGSEYESAALTALEVLVGSAGRTTTGAGWATDADQMSAFGLALQGAPNFIDYTKIKSLRNGSLIANGTNAAPDYPEVRTALGLVDGDFHMRTYPVLPTLQDPRWNKEPNGRLAYFAHYSGATSPVAITTSTSKTATTLNVTITLENVGVKDAIYSTVISVGNQTAGTKVVSEERNTRLLAPSTSQTLWVNFDQMAGWPAAGNNIHIVVTDSYGDLAVSSGGITIGDFWIGGGPPPTGGLNSRGILVSANSPYYVTGDKIEFDTDAYDGTGAHPGGTTMRFVLMGPNEKEWKNYSFTLNTSKKGTAWAHVCSNCTAVGNYTGIVWDSGMTRSARDVVHVSAAKMFTEKTTISPVAQTEIGYLTTLVAQFNPTRYDALTNPAGDIFGDDSNGPSEIVDLLPRYQYLVVGSEVSQTSLTPSQTKNGIANWVQASGNLIVLGTYTSQSRWLEPIYHAAQANANGGITAPDATNPILVSPERLSYDTYLDRGRAWNIKSDEPFTHVLTRGSSGNSVDDTLTYANPGSLGNGTVILTSYMPGSLTAPQDDVEARRLFHNLLSQGYTMLFLDYGPQIPSGVPVGSSERLVAIPHPNVPGAVVEVKLVMYVFG